MFPESHKALLTSHRTEAAAGQRFLNQTVPPTKTTVGYLVNTNVKAAYANEGSPRSGSMLSTLHGFHCYNILQSPVLWGLEMLSDLPKMTL